MVTPAITGTGVLVPPEVSRTATSLPASPLISTFQCQACLGDCGGLFGGFGDRREVLMRGSWLPENASGGSIWAKKNGYFFLA